MKLKHTLIAGLFLSGISLFAGEPLLIKTDKGNEFLNTKPELAFKKKSSLKDAFKLNKSAAFSGKEWDEAEVTGSGLFLNFGIHFPSSKFLNPYYESGDPKYKLGFDFELGSYFRFVKIQDGKMGIGLRVTWLSAGYSTKKDEDDVYRALQLSALRLGPQFSYAIDDHMGFDVFYQWGYNFTNQFGSIDSPGNSKKIGENAVFTGGSHEVGAAFHYKVFSLGFGYRFGSLTLRSYIYDGKSADSETIKILAEKKFPVNNFRITLGFRF